jgi:TolB-like protein
LPKVGYRFLGSVQVKGNGTASEAPSNTESATASLTPEPALIAPRLWKSKGLLVWLVILALAILGTWWLRDRFRRPDPEIHSIAVLPLQNLSGDPSQEYFADGTTEELISALARLSDLRVTSRTSAMQFKRVQKSAKEIGRLLDVDAIVEGSVARSGDTVRITVQLIDAHADKHLWAGEYHSSLSDVLRQQEEIAHDIALNVSAKIAPQDDRQPAAAKAIDPQAHDLYLRARQHAAEWDQPGMRRAIELYQRAIQLQPDYAAAYVGLADAHSIFAIQETESEWPQVREAASKALSLDSSVTGAHAQLAQVKHIYDWDTAAAQEEFKKALKTDRDSAETHMKYALFLAQIGRIEEGLAEAQFAEELDPLSSRISGTKEKIFMIARRYDDVFKQAKRTRELYPDNYVTALHVLETYQLLGRYQESIDEEEAHPEPGGWTQHEAAIFANKLRSALRSQGPKGYWGALLQYRLDTQADDHCLLAYAYFRTGDHENGYRQLDLAIKGRDRNLRQMKTHPMWDFVRDDPRFQDVLRRVGY